ncbi:MAG: helix-turn-helix transcriptional regulator [Hydrogenophilales bacterium]|nr:helix-turn-helix transcriptional regulator [Hydrogenophilales bacterium]
MNAPISLSSTTSNMADTPDQDFSGLNVHGLSRVVLELNRASREAAFSRFQPLALELIREIIPFDSAWWGNAAAEPMEIHRLYLCNCDDSILENYRPLMAQDFFLAALMAQPGVTINMADLTSRARYVRTELYRKVGKPYRVEWSLGTLLLEPVSSLQEFLTLWRHDGKKPFSETERKTKELLMPHLAEAHRAARLREVLEGAHAQHERWAVADERGYLREANPGFIHCLREHWPDWQGSLLPEALLECIRSATNFSSTRLKMRIAPKGAFRYMQALTSCALDSLSPREHDIATRYARGETYAGIAAVLKLSPATVRNHIANCYRKLAVNNKAELVARVLRTAN